MTFLFRIEFTWWLGHFISRYLKVHFMLIKYTCDSKSQTLRMRYPFQSTGRPISHRNGWSFRVYMIPLRDFVPEWNSRPGARTGVNSRRGDSRRHDILWWYHVNKCRATRGNRSEHTTSRRSPRCHGNTPLIFALLRWFHVNGTPERTNFPPIESFFRAVWTKLNMNYVSACVISSEFTRKEVMKFLPAQFPWIWYISQVTQARW